MSTRTLSRRLKFIRRMRSIAPNWAKMAEFTARQTPDGIDVATGSWHGDRTVVNIGEKSFFVKSDLITSEPEIWDFAVFGLAAISSRRNRIIRFDKPVSKSAAGALKRICYAYSLWCIPSLSPPRIELSNVVDDPIKSNDVDRKIMCFSGGVDSTSSAIFAVSEAAYTHALLIAGADYPSADHGGFIELRRRAKANAKILGLKLVVCETNFRSMSIDWELQHSFLLAMVLNYHSSDFCEGSYALDAPPVNEIVQHPWGNCSALMHLFSTKNLPLKSYGAELHRSEKVRNIYAFSNRLIRKLSICWQDTSIGGNCGICKKCLRFRDICQNSEIPTDGLFKREAEKDFWSSVRYSRDYRARIDLVMYADWVNSIDEGTEERQKMLELLEELRHHYVKKMPYR